MFFQNGVEPDVRRFTKSFGKATYIWLDDGQNADAVVDIPGNFFWEEILEAFPDCKVIRTRRGFLGKKFGKTP